MLSASCCFLVVLRSLTFSPVLRLQSPPRQREAGPMVASRSLRKSVMRVRVSSPRSRQSPAPHGIPSPSW
ncbi:hypothetical protein L227DRAFT_579479 [Lentinus tigrinus ALCF2SS1-6]|uniref:Secreted protein n=1 Tax=Lentinus tigrinus ALCF2SS1-6 TaxID=1328759 RepID=A0A5C2RXF5_9APHY|nr:hypothetical protein L227DRAFT_579479 [Lentinus tigrinus ALCF2SS1-6]